MTDWLSVPPSTDDSTAYKWMLELYHYLLLERGQVINVSDTGVAADTEFTVAHDLRRIPRYVERVVTEADDVQDVEVYRSGTAWTRTDVYLRCTQANANITVRVF